MIKLLLYCNWLLMCTQYISGSVLVYFCIWQEPFYSQYWHQTLPYFCLGVGWQCIPEPQKINQILGCIHWDIHCWRQTQDHPNLLSACQAAPGLLHAVLGPTDQERCRKTGVGQRRFWRLWGTFPEGKLKEFSIFFLEKRLLMETTSQYFNI